MTIEFKADKKAKQAIEDYAKGKQPPMTFINSYENGKQAVLSHVLTPLSSIIKNDYGFSIYGIFDSSTADELNKYDSLAQRQVPNGFIYKKLLNDDDKIYLKLKVVDDKFAALAFATPEEYDEVNLDGLNLKVDYSLGVWMNFESKTAGTFLKAVSITKV